MNPFTNYLDKLGSHFLVAAMVPSLGLVIACLVVFDPIIHMGDSLKADNGIYSLIGVTLLLAIPTVIIGFTLTAMNTFILKVFEGYVFFHRFPFMRNTQNRKAEKLINQKDEIKQRINTLLQKSDLSPEQEVELDELRTSYYTIVSAYDQSYPPQYAGIMPTRFGNILKASEAYAGSRYGIDSVPFWPRLLHVIPASYRQTIDEARNELSFLVNMSTLSIVFYILCILAILSKAPLPGTSPNWSAVFDDAARYILAGALALLVNIFFNKAAIFSVGDFGMVIRSAYDLFRMDLLEQFRLEQPENSGKEFELWQNLGELIVLGQDSLDFKHLQYKIKTK